MREVLPLARRTPTVDAFTAALHAVGVLVGSPARSVPSAAIASTDSATVRARRPPTSEFEACMVYFLRSDGRSHISIGRHADNDLVIVDETISQDHARVYPVDEGVLRVQDMGSRNGTLARGAFVLLGTSVRIRSGELVQFGHLPFRYYELARLWRMLRNVIPSA